MSTNTDTVCRTPSIHLAQALRSLGRVFEYPGSDTDELLRCVSKSLTAEFTDAHCCFQGFAAAFLALSQDQREELYTGTFDVTPVCVPYVSIHLFGEENFKRGEFMATLNARHAQIGFHSQGELSDHIAVLLRFAAQIDVTEQRELVEFCLLGPVGKMLAGLSLGNPYQAALKTVQQVLQAAYPDVQPALSPLDQMRQHGATCGAVSFGCGCGSVSEASGSNKTAPNY